MIGIPDTSQSGFCSNYLAGNFIRPIPGFAVCPKSELARLAFQLGGDSESSSDDSDGSVSGVRSDTEDEKPVRMREIEAATTTPLCRSSQLDSAYRYVKIDIIFEIERSN